MVSGDEVFAARHFLGCTDEFDFHNNPNLTPKIAKKSEVASFVTSLWDFCLKHCGLFHHNLSDGMTTVGFDVHHVDAFSHVREVDADLIAFEIGIVNRLTVSVHDAHVA